MKKMFVYSAYHACVLFVVGCKDVQTWFKIGTKGALWLEKTV